MGKKIQLTETELINLIEKMVKEYDKPAMASFQKQYGKKKGKSVYYATANKQKRNPETFKLKEADDSKKGKLFIPRNIDKRAEEREEMINKIIGNEELMKGIISKAADETSQDDYYDVYDWMDDVLSVVENELEGMGLNDSEGDIISDIKDKYDDYLINMWGGSDDNDDDFEQGKNPYECAKNYVEFLFNKSIMDDENVVGGGDLFYWNNNKIPKMNDDKAYGRFIKHLKYSMDNEIYSDEECEGTTFEDIEPFIKKLYSSEISRKSK